MRPNATKTQKGLCFPSSFQARHGKKGRILSILLEARKKAGRRELLSVRVASSHVDALADVRGLRGRPRRAARCGYAGWTLAALRTKFPRTKELRCSEQFF